jgi:hypothetical protein
MRRTITCSLLSALIVLQAGFLLAQPVLVNTMTPFPVGYTDSGYSAAATIAPGSGGAGVTWNYSTLTPIVGGVIQIVDPSTTPYFSTFPTATFCAKLMPVTGGSAYVYERVSSAKWEQLANNYAGVGTGDDYTPNPESQIRFPMSYLDSFVDTFQKTTGGPNTVTITYDGYGTLITPFATYTNVVRIKKYWGPGDFDYNWYQTSPNIGIIANFDASGNKYGFFRPPTSEKVSLPNGNVTAATIFPNPAASSFMLLLTGMPDLTHTIFMITDVAGKVVRQIPVTGEQTSVQCDRMPAGLYFYTVYNNGTRVANGKLVIQ